MSDDLTGRLTERIDWLHDRTPWIGARAYLEALKAIVELHLPDSYGDACAYCDAADQPWPCATLCIAAEALGVEP